MAISLALLLPAPVARAQAGDIGFVQLTVNDEEPIAFFPAYIGEGEVPYLQFDALMRAIELPISFDAGLGSAAGVLPDGSTRFELNLERGTVLAGEVTHRLAADAYRLIEQRLFVRHSAVSAWLPVTVEWSVAEYAVQVTTGYVLPSRARARREARRERLRAHEAAQPSPAELEREVPWFDPGMFQFNTSARGGNESPDELLLNLRGVHRFLKGDLEYSITESHVDGELRDPELDLIRLTYYDPLRTRQAQFGDTFASFSPLVLDTVSFRGASFYTGGRPQRFGRTTLIGTAPPDSEVDLYRSGVLVDFTTADEQGFYRFENVPLTLDATLFEAHIFTPRGEKIVQFHEVVSQEEMVRQGALATQGGYGQGEQATGEFTVLGAEARYGLFAPLTLGAYILELRDFLVSFDTIAKQRTGGAFLVWRPIDWMLLLGERAADAEVEGGGTRWDAFLGFRGLTVELERRAYTGAFAPPQRTRSSAFSELERADTITTLETRTRVFAANLELRLTHSDFGQERVLDEQRLRVDRRLTRNLSTFVTLRRERSSEPSFPENGSDVWRVLTSYRLSPLGRLEFAAERSSTLRGPTASQFRATWLKNFRTGSPWSYELTYLARSEQDDLAQGALGYLFANNIRLSGRVDSDGVWFAQADYTLPFRVSGEGFERLPPNTFGRAGVEGEVYVDADGDGTRDPAEQPLPGVEVLAPGAGRLFSGDGGRFRGWGLGATEPVNVEVNLLTTDALYTPARKRHPLAARPGELVRLDIAMVPSGGLDGILHDDEPGDISPAEGLEMVLRRPDGGEVARGRVEWDGRFIMEGVPPGTFTLSADPDALAERGLELVPAAREVVFPSGRDPVWLFELEFRVRPAGAG